MTATVEVATGDGRPPMSAATAAGPIDRVHLSRYTLGNRDLENEVLQRFAEQAPKYLEGLRSSANDKSWREAAHTLKGSALAVGAMRVAAAAERAELLDIGEGHAARESAVAAVAAAVDEARRHVAALIGGA